MIPYTFLYHQNYFSNTKIYYSLRFIVTLSRNKTHNTIGTRNVCVLFISFLAKSCGHGNSKQHKTQSIVLSFGRYDECRINNIVNTISYSFSQKILKKNFHSLKKMIITTCFKQLMKFIFYSTSAVLVVS